MLARQQGGEVAVKWWYLCRVLEAAGLSNKQELTATNFWAQRHGPCASSYCGTLHLRRWKGGTCQAGTGGYSSCMSSRRDFASWLQFRDPSASTC